MKRIPEGQHSPPGAVWPLRTLVAGSNIYEEVSGIRKILETTWRVVHLCSDHLYEPVYAALQVHNGLGKRSVTLPPEVRVLPLNRSPHRPFHHRLFADVNWERKRYASYLDEVEAVCCFFPDWYAVHIHRMAVERGMITFAILLGDWVDVYERMASSAPTPKRQMLRRLARHADRALKEVARNSRILFCVGQALANRYGHLAPQTVVCNANLQEESHICEREDTCRQPPFKLLCVAEFHPRKGIEVLLDAAALLHQEGHPVELHLVGDGALRSTYEAQARSLDIGDFVRFLGYVRFGSELFSVYRECDLFILPSLAGEGCPRVLVEAMSQGTPVIGTDVGSVRHMVSSGINGLVVPSGSARALADAAAAILTDGEMRRRLIRGGLDYAHAQTYSIQRQRIGEALREFVPEVVKTTQKEGE